jgi:hypothetical protein
VRLVVRRGTHRLEAFLALDQLDQLLRMLGHVQAHLARDDLGVEVLGLADSGALGAGLSRRGELEAGRARRSGLAAVGPHDRRGSGAESEQAGEAGSKNQTPHANATHAFSSLKTT